jgi:hypothetical protein
MPGHRLQFGEPGDISYQHRGDKVTASLYYRNNDGRRRRIEATAATRTAARRKALDVLGQRLASASMPSYTSRTTFRDLAGEWIAHLDELVAMGRRSPSTVGLYRHGLDRHVLPGIGDLRLGELTPARLDHFLHQKRRERGIRPRNCAGRSPRVCAAWLCVGRRCGPTRSETCPASRSTRTRSAGSHHRRVSGVAVDPRWDRVRGAHPTLTWRGSCSEPGVDLVKRSALLGRTSTWTASCCMCAGPCCGSRARGWWRSDRSQGRVPGHCACRFGLWLCCESDVAALQPIRRSSRMPVAGTATATTSRRTSGPYGHAVRVGRPAHLSQDGGYLARRRRVQRAGHRRSVGSLAHLHDPGRLHGSTRGGRCRRHGAGGTWHARRRRPGNGSAGGGLT